MTLFVDGVFDDRPLAELGIPVIRGSGPDDPGVSEVDVVGCDDDTVRSTLEAQGATILETLPEPMPTAPHADDEHDLDNLAVATSTPRRKRFTPLIAGLVGAGAVELAVHLLHH